MKIRELFKKESEIKITAKAPQEYRDELARILKAMRKKGDKGRKKAMALLDKEKGSPIYFYSSTKGARKLGMDVAESLIKYNDDGLHYVANNLHYFRGLFNEKFAIMMIENGYAGDVARNLSRFKLNKEIAYKLIDKGYGYYVIVYKDKFKGLVEDKEIAKQLIKRPGRMSDANLKLFLMNIDTFKGLDKEIAYMLIEIRGDRRDVFKHIKNFEGLELNMEFAQKLIDEGFGEIILKNPGNFGLKFEQLDQKKIAKKVIDEGSIFRGIEYVIDLYKELDCEIAQKLIDEGFGYIVERYPEKFGLKKEK